MADGQSIEAKLPRHVLDGPSRWHADLLSYGSAMVVVAVAFVALAAVLNHGPRYPAASDADTAILIDLPPAESAANPARDVKEGPVTEAAPASQATETPKPVEPPKPIEKPEPEMAAPLVEAPPPAPNLEAVLERKHEEAKPPQPIAPAPSAAPQEERAPAGSDSPTVGKSDQGDEAQPHASPQAISQWQKSLILRLEAAKRAFGHAARMNGTVKVAFEIDTRGAIISEKVAESSGSPALDQAATALVKKAAPFPAPPSGAAQNDMSFIVPIRFRH